MANIFESTEHDFYYAKAIILLYLYESKDPVQEKVEMVAKYLKHFPDDEPFQLFHSSLIEHNDLPSPDTMIDQDMIDMSYQDMVDDVENIPGKADFDIYLTKMAEIDKITRFKESYTRTLKRKNLTLTDINSLLNQWGNDMNIAVVEEEDNKSIEVLKRNIQNKGDMYAGVKEIDEVTLGFRKGNLLAIGGYAGSGKTSFMLSILYYNAVVLKKNCVFITFEVTTDEIRGWLISRHSKNIKFIGRGRPVDRIKSQDINLPEKDLKFLGEVGDDLFENPDYGKIVILEQKHITNLEIQAFKNTVYSHAPDVDIIFFDHLHATKNYPIPGITNEFRQMNYLVLGFNEKVAKDFFGRKVLFVLGAQINREKYAQAKINYEKGKPPYDNDCWSGVNEIDRCAFYALTLFSNEELMEREELLIQLIKHRVGRKLSTPVVTKIIPGYIEIGDNILLKHGVSHENE
jgi:hypothetical protein